MQLVLTQNEATEWGHDYADVLGVSYEYPAKLYHHFVQPGVDFVYYRGRRKEGGGTQPQVYLGAGVVGAIDVGSQPGLLTCQIKNYQAFATPVPFKIDGRYLEEGAQPLGSRAGLYFRRGVREIDESTYSRICALGGLGI